MKRNKLILETNSSETYSSLRQTRLWDKLILEKVFFNDCMVVESVLHIVCKHCIHTQKHNACAVLLLHIFFRTLIGFPCLTNLYTNHQSQSCNKCCYALSLENAPYSCKCSLLGFCATINLYGTLFLWVIAKFSMWIAFNNDMQHSQCELHL